MVDKSELRKTLLAMKKRVKEFGALRAECCWRERCDGFPGGWLSTKICKFEKDMEELVKQALKIERKSCNG